MTYDLEHFRARIMQDAMDHAAGSYWERRAATFEWARPRPTDYTGRATPAQIAEQDRRLEQVVRLCLSRANLRPEEIA